MSFVENLIQEGSVRRPLLLSGSALSAERTEGSRVFPGVIIASGIRGVKANSRHGLGAFSRRGRRKQRSSIFRNATVVEI